MAKTSSPTALDYFGPGLREITRRVQRGVAHARLAWVNRSLARAEKTLGLLAWQQADYDPETQRLVQAIHDVEKEQTALVNEAAVLGQEIRKGQLEREAARRQQDEARRRMEGERTRLTAPQAELERRLADRRKVEPNFMRHIPDLDRELRDTQRLYNELLSSDRQGPQVRQEIARLRERIVAIPNEKNDLRTQHLRTVTEIQSTEQALARGAEDVVRLEQEMGESEARWHAEETVQTDRVREQEREKNHIEKRIDALEGLKANPYLQIGQVLADHNIGPVNQPEALETVRQLRFRAGALEQELLESTAASEAEAGSEMGQSLLLWVGGVSGLVLFVLAVLLA